MLHTDGFLEIERALRFRCLDLRFDVGAILFPHRIGCQSVAATTEAPTTTESTAASPAAAAERSAAALSTAAAAEHLAELAERRHDRAADRCGIARRARRGRFCGRCRPSTCRRFVDGAACQRVAANENEPYRRDRD